MTFNFTDIGIWILRLLAAAIMLQTLFFKFTAAPESVYIFSTLNMEPWGRIGVGVMELIASILILFPRTSGIGSALAIGVMSGAIYFHLTKLGIEVMNDGGQLFIYALLVLISSVILLIIHKNDLIHLIKTNF